MNMDDYSISTLHESKNEWTARLVNILYPLVIEGLYSIFDEAVKICKENNENEKYLMTFQNFISRIPKWNPTIIANERQRIYEKSGCSYLEELLTCTHIIQLKLLTSIRGGSKQKKVDIAIPKIDDFIHKTYIFVARKIYKNVYLFEVGIPPLQIQKNNRELELIVQECILNSVRDSIPVENILRAYMDESVEEDVTEEIFEEKMPNEKKTQEQIKTDIQEEIQQLQQKDVVGGAEIVTPTLETSFEPIASVDTNNNIHDISSSQDKEDNEDNRYKLQITEENVNLDDDELEELKEKDDDLPELLLDNIEILD